MYAGTSPPREQALRGLEHASGAGCGLRSVRCGQDCVVDRIHLPAAKEEMLKSDKRSSNLMAESSGDLRDEGNREDPFYTSTGIASPKEDQIAMNA
jgi:hypothetical protein